MTVLMAVTSVVAVPAASHAVAAPAPHAAAAAPATDLALATGDNWYGQLGDGSGIGSQTTPVPVALPEGVSLTQIAAGHSHSLGLTSDGRVLAWGNNSNGQLGDDSTTTRRTPVWVHLPGGVTITQISAGSFQSMALTSDGRVLAWGQNNLGQLGDGTTITRPAPVLVALPLDVTITQISSGSQHNLGLTSDGRVLSWGWNSSGQLGDGTTTQRLTPVPVALPPGVTIDQIDSGYYHNLALTSDGHVLGWGDNYYGAVGDGSTTQRNSPVPVALPPGVTITQVSAGYYQSLALASNGQVLAWGYNEFGQLGDGTTTERLTPVPVALPGGVTVTQISAGWGHSLALTSHGRVLGWGGNDDGALGDGTTVNRYTPVFMEAPPGHAVTEVSAGWRVSLMLAEPTGSSTTLTAEPAQALPGQEVRLTATVTCSHVPAAGIVTFLEGDTVIGTAELDAHGVATLTTTGLAEGRHHITARYGGNAFCPPSTSAPVTVTITEHPAPPCGPYELKVDKTADKARVRVGNKVRYRIHVTNTCASTFTGATFTDDLTGVLRNGRIRGSIHATTGHITRTGRGFTWTGDLAAGRSADITFTVVARTPGIMRNQVTWRCHPSDTARRDETADGNGTAHGNCTSRTRTKVILPSTI
ncbi:Ig-like domain repeat protein [Spirillospora sp. NPDC052269]